MNKKINMALKANNEQLALTLAEKELDEITKKVNELDKEATIIAKDPCANVPEWIDNSTKLNKLIDRYEKLQRIVDLCIQKGW